MTDEQKKAFGAKMKAARAAAKEAKIGTVEVEVETDIQALLKRINELEARNYIPAQGPNLIGTKDKYTINPLNYADPIERLSNEARLQQFAFKLNYELKWNVSSTSYKTLDGINTREPKFELELIKIVLDDNGDQTNERFIVKKMIFHEDPDAAVIIAKENGLAIDESNQVDFLNEMRYLRARDWLIECFYPAKSTAIKNKKQTVIGNRLVDIYEISSSEAQKIPFGDLQGRA